MTNELSTDEQRIVDVCNALGMLAPEIGDDGDSVKLILANAMESMLSLLDLQDEVIDKLSDELVVTYEKHEEYFKQINDYCIELEQDCNMLAEEIVNIKSHSCSCDVVTKTMETLK